FQYPGIEAAKASFDQLDQPGAGDHGTIPAPYTPGSRQVAAVQPSQNQLPQVERIALGEPPQSLHRAPIDLPAESLADQLRNLRTRKRLDLEPVGNGVLPQRDDGAGRRRPAAHSD